MFTKDREHLHAHTHWPRPPASPNSEPTTHEKPHNSHDRVLLHWRRPPYPGKRRSALSVRRNTPITKACNLILSSTLANGDILQMESTTCQRSKASTLCTVTSVTRTQQVGDLFINVQHVQKLSVVGKSLLIMFFIHGIKIMTKKVLPQSHWAPLHLTRSPTGYGSHRAAFRFCAYL